MIIATTAKRVAPDRRRQHSRTLRLVTLGVGTQASPRYAPAGLLVQRGKVRVMIDGGPGAAQSGPLAAWLVTDEQGELMPRIRELARAKGVEPYAGPFQARGLVIECHSVVHTTHSAFGYVIRACGARVVWAPEFFEFPPGQGTLHSCRNRIGRFQPAASANVFDGLDTSDLQFCAGVTVNAGRVGLFVQSRFHNLTAGLRFGPE